MRKGIVCLAGIISLVFVAFTWGAEAEMALAPADPRTGQPQAFAPSAPELWQDNVGQGFNSSVQTFSVEPALVLGVQAFGGELVHDLALMSVSYGRMWGKVRGQGHWYRGNWEVRAEIFGGGQFSPKAALLAGLTPHLRYDFATGTRWVPFFDVGAGVTASGIGPPDQSGVFEFNTQGSVGTQFFIRGNLALTADVGYLHMSCAGINSPHLGVNTIKTMFGATWFF